MEPALAAEFPEIRTLPRPGPRRPDGHGSLRLDARRLPRDGACAPGGTRLHRPLHAGATRRTTSATTSGTTRRAGPDLPVPRGRRAIAPGPRRAARDRRALGQHAAHLPPGRGRHRSSTPPSTAAPSPRRMAAIVTTMNRVNGVYEREVAVRMVLVANNDADHLHEREPDPYTNSNGSTDARPEPDEPSTTSSGRANYDIGHVFSTGGGGVAGLGVVCSAGSKARGVTGQSQPDRRPLRHRLRGPRDGPPVRRQPHLQRQRRHLRRGNRNASTAYEPGSGSTIMAYAGICGAEDLQPNSDDYFHTMSFDRDRGLHHHDGRGTVRRRTRHRQPAPR